MIKKIIAVVLLLVLAGISYLAISGNKLREVVTEIEVSAPPEQVWSVLKGFNKWHEWSPIIDSSSGEFKLGSELDITMTNKGDGGESPRYKATIIELKENESLRWEAHMMSGFLFTNFKELNLQKTSTGTKLVHKEQFKGLLTPLMWGQMESGVPPMLDSMNQALKELVESGG